MLVANPAQSQSDTFAPNAPDTYTVQRGDTLWGIAQRFLQQPWRWPEVWQINRDEVKNPHLIYPGQVIILDRSAGRLSIGRVITDQKLSPQVYSEPLKEAISSIPLEDIEPFLVRQLIVEQEDLERAGTVVATENQRVYTAAGDVIFAKDVEPGIEGWQVFRPARPLVDPETKETLAYEAHFLGQARLVDPASVGPNGERTPATLRVTEAIEEIGEKDRLMKIDQPRILSYIPRAPETDIDGRLIGIYRGVAETGRHHVVTLNIGAREGLEVGHVIALHRKRGTVTHRGDDGKERFALPDARYGVAFVFRVFNRVAYALVMDTDGHVSVGDRVSRP
ncbi:MAG: LysM peptidoglycan-binding domain-containing protein [Pseudazoarcus pumilus]|nr:LysM peptidoglycan-binding domain-containing protein [Pseudazoarcus pumilus]